MLHYGNYWIKITICEKSRDNNICFLQVQRILSIKSRELILLNDSLREENRFGRIQWCFWNGNKILISSNTLRVSLRYQLDQAIRFLSFAEPLKIRHFIDQKTFSMELFQTMYIEKLFFPKFHIYSSSLERIIILRRMYIYTYIHKCIHTYLHLNGPCEKSKCLVSFLVVYFNKTCWLAVFTFLSVTIKLL